MIIIRIKKAHLKHSFDINIKKNILDQRFHQEQHDESLFDYQKDLRLMEESHE
jgi:hypothetical protein